MDSPSWKDSFNIDSPSNVPYYHRLSTVVDNIKYYQSNFEKDYTEPKEKLEVARITFKVGMQEKFMNRS